MSCILFDEEKGVESGVPTIGSSSRQSMTVLADIRRQQGQALSSI